MALSQQRVSVMTIHGGTEMGKTLIQEISEGTGLPQDLIQNELHSLISSAGANPQELTLEDLRKILAEYAQDVLLAAKEELAG